MRRKSKTMEHAISKFVQLIKKLCIIYALKDQREKNEEAEKDS